MPLATATRSTRPPIGAVIVDSIFIASITATGVAGLDLVADARPAMITAPITGAATWPGLAGSARSISATVDLDRAVADVERAAAGR